MNLKNCKYMRNTEFKARQAWLEFTDAVGIVLEIMAEIKEESAAWFKKWVKDFRTPKKEVEKQEQLKINFLSWINVESKNFNNLKKE